MTPQYLTRIDAAAACGCHVDTIRRAEKDGRLPNTRKNGRAIELSVTDLVEAGLLQPIAGTDVETIVGRSRLERDLVAARQALTETEVRLEAASARNQEYAAEVEYLRRTLQKAVA